MKRIITILGAWTLAMGCSGAPGAPNSTASAPGQEPTATQAAALRGRSQGHGRHVMAWGVNGFGQIGNGQEEEGALTSAYPYVLENVPEPKQIYAADNHSLLLTHDGHVWSWGSNSNRQLGDGTHIDRPLPQRITTIDDVEFVGGGFYFSVAIKKDGTVWAWGDNVAAELGQGTTGPDQLTPVLVPLPKKAKKLAVGGGFTMALLEDGTVWAWGGNESGSFGSPSCPADPTQACGTVTSPVEIPELAALGRVVDLAGYYQHSLFVLHDGTVWATGLNYAGQLGNGSADPNNNVFFLRHPLAPVLGFGGASPKAKMVATGIAHSLAIDENGDVYGWGYNPDGQAGVIPDVYVKTPAMVTCGGQPCLHGATIVQAGHYSGEALVHGHVWAWGRADQGELGQIVPCCSAVPLEVPGVSGVEMLSTTAEHTLAYGRYRPNEAACDHPSAYLIADLAPLPGDVQARPFGLNGDGLAVGVSLAADGSEHAVLWGYDAIPVALGALPGDTQSQAVAINDAGDIVGASFGAVGDAPVRFTGGTVVPLPTLPGAARSSDVFGLNSAGVAVGDAVLPGDPNVHAVEYLATEAKDLGTGLLGSVLPTSINDSGEIVGISRTPSDPNFPQEAARIGHGGLRVLASNPPSYPACQAWGINSQGDAAGYCETAGLVTQAVLYHQGAAILLGALPGDVGSYSGGINDRGQVAGGSYSDTAFRGVLFDEGNAIDLSTRVTNLGTWWLGLAWKINDNGQILGMGEPDGTVCTPQQSCPTPHAYLLTPSCDGQ